MIERHDIEDSYREAQLYKQERAYESMEQSGELQESYLRAICENAEIPEEIEVYSDVYDIDVWVKYDNVFDKDENRIIKKLLKLSIEDDTIDSDKFIALFDHNIIRYRDAHIKANLSRLKGYQESLSKALGELWKMN